MPIVKVRDRHQITIPKAVAERLSLEPGDLLEVGEREAEHDIEAGRVSGPFRSADELLAHLHQQIV